jgi:cyclase
MLKKRIIPCLDIHNGRTVKGVNFVAICDAGDPIELAKKYIKDGADELVFLDITATNEKRKTWVDLVEKIAREIHIPFTVGGGIHSIDDASALIKAGADKVSINTAAILRPALITEIASILGSQAVVVAIDTQFINDDWYVFSNGGKNPVGIKTIDWALQAETLGAGEILLTSMNNDGTKNGFALDITHQITQQINIPVIASGGAGNMVHFREVFEQTKASGALAASVFHFGEISIQTLKTYLKTKNIAIR